MGSAAAAEVDPAITRPPAAAPSPDLIDAAPEESSAEHLAGSSAALVSEIDEKFTHLLHEVHKNRPGDDLEIIRQAWQFCLEQHEGQKRA